jgi:polyisoprenoid-binding protein YceI
MRFIFITLFIVLYSSLCAQVYVPVDATSKVSFKIKNFGSTVDGSFKGLKGTIHFDVSNVSNAIFDVTINAATINTGIGMRDSHLRKPDYLNVADFPTIRFVSGKVEESGKANERIVTGKLTIKKTTKEISFPFQYSEANGVLKFTGAFTINRIDFGVGGNSFSLADELTVMLDVRASK